MDGCSDCGGELVEETVNAEALKVCIECGSIASQASGNLTSEHDDGQNAATFVHSETQGGGGKPHNYKWHQQSKRLGPGKKTALEVITNLCSLFHIRKTTKQLMFKTVRKLFCRCPEEVAAAVFLVLARQELKNENAGHILTLREVSNAVSLPVSAIASRIKRVRDILSRNADGDVDPLELPRTLSGNMSTVVPNPTFKDPFGSSVSNERVLSLAGKILDFAERVSTRQLDAVPTTLAAIYISWNSTFFFNSKYNTLQKGLGSVAPKEARDFPRFFREAGLPLTKHLKPSVQRKLCDLVALLSPYVEKLPWLRIKGKVTKKEIFQHIEEVLEHEEAVYSLVVEEKREKLKSQPPAAVPAEPAMRIVFTAPANWTCEDLTEEDLPESEMVDYIRTPAEVKAVKRFVASTETREEETRIKRKKKCF